VRKIKFIAALLLTAALTMSGCSFRTVDQLYSVPKRSEEYNNLQTAVDKAMSGMEYCAPLAGENQQTMQMADLDGDGFREYLLFAKSGAERPLHILIFRAEGEDFVHADTIECNGTAFDQVEYVQMDDRPGVELVVGRQLDAQVLRNVAVYTFSAGEAEQLVSTNYTKFLTVDMNADSRSELFVLRPGQTETDRGIAELYSVGEGGMERSNEVNMSEPAEHLKRLIVGKLYGGEPAIYVASAVEDTALITDVYALKDDLLTNITFSNESGTSVHTMRNYYVYADDIDNDGVVELPSLLAMQTLDESRANDRHDLIRWYAMRIDGGEVDKIYTYHNFVSGWYLHLDSRWAKQLTVERQGNQYELFILDEWSGNVRRVATIFALTGQNREEQALEDGRFVLYKTDSVVYAASLEPVAASYGITQESMVRSFHLIQQDWKTGET